DGIPCGAEGSGGPRGRRSREYRRHPGNAQFVRAPPPWTGAGGRGYSQRTRIHPSLDGRAMSTLHVEPPPRLSPEETLRYARHLTLPEIGPAGQAKLRSARVLLIGAGGLGSPSALYLAAAGVGTLGLVDFDVVD